MRIEDSECRVAEGREKSGLEAVENRPSVMLVVSYLRIRGGKLEDYADATRQSILSAKSPHVPVP